MNVFELNRHIWQTRVLPKPDPALAMKLSRIVQAQHHEVYEHDYFWDPNLGPWPARKVANEFADMILIAARGIETCGFDPEQHSIERLLLRHVGRTAEIREKYRAV